MNNVDPAAPRIQALERRRAELMAQRSKLVTWKGRSALRACRALEISYELRQIEKTLQAIKTQESKR